MQTDRHSVDEWIGGQRTGKMVSWRRPETRRYLDDKLKELMQELGNAINESLSDSDRIAEAIGEIKRSGYDVFLVLEATIGFNKRDETEEVSASMEVGYDAATKLKWTNQDHKFLRALKISTDEE